MNDESRLVPDEGGFIPEQSSLKSSSLVCPHCGEPLPQEPELLEPADVDHGTYLNEMTALYNRELQQVEIFGGDSGFSEDDPYTIEADRIGEPRDVARWMARLSGEAWARDQTFFEDLGEALCQALEEPAPGQGR